MIQETALRTQGARFDPPLVVCSQEHRFLVAEQLHAIGIKNARIILEPAGRDSAPAAAAAAMLVAEEDPNAILWIMAADAAIGDLTSLYHALDCAILAAAMGNIVTFGVWPTGPHTGYGYMQMGAPLTGVGGAFRVSRFVEKPDSETAKTFIADGRYLWNSGMFVSTAGMLLAEIELHMPDIVLPVRAAVEKRIRDLDFTRLDAEAFLACQSISLDYAVAERTARAVVVPAPLTWSDVGSWAALWELGPKDDNGNVVIGDAEVVDAHGCYVRSEDRLSAVIGLRDVALITTSDAVLAMPLERAQDVKKIVDRLKAAGRCVATEHRQTYRPWGFYESLIQGSRFQVKRIVVQPNRQLSLQSHYHRAEHWIVVSGTARVTRDNDVIIIHENEFVYLPPGCVHRLENPGKIPLILIEVQVGGYLGEDDIVRYEDAYGRI